MSLLSNILPAATEISDRYSDRLVDLINAAVDEAQTPEEARDVMCLLAISTHAGVAKMLTILKGEDPQDRPAQQDVAALIDEVAALLRKILLEDGDVLRPRLN
jgi:hypothetical protein